MNYYNEIKNELINNEIYKKVKDYSKNKSDLTTYYNVGKLLSEAGSHYGESIIKNYSEKLTNELGKKYDPSVLNKMRKFYFLIEKMATLSPKLSYSHYVELLPFSNLNKIAYYIKIIEENNLSIRELRARIKSKEYERLPESTRNKLIVKDKTEVSDFVKNPIIIKNKHNIDADKISEKLLQELILEDIPSFLDELGEGFTFIRNEYKIKIGNNYHRIDLLLFNYIYNCFVVIELKISELKSSYIGQIQEYMNYIDKNVKKAVHDKTIGIIIVKKDNKFVMEYCSNKKIFNTTYKLV
jgi:predicted nuclease of restriction endonuclease-like (RecB) superfamily